MLLQTVDRRHRGVACSEHGVDGDDETLGEHGGRLEVILHGNQGFRIAIESDMGHSGRGNQVEHALDGHVEADSPPS